MLGLVLGLVLERLERLARLARLARLVLLRLVLEVVGLLEMVLVMLQQALSPHYCLRLQRSWTNSYGQPQEKGSERQG